MINKDDFSIVTVTYNNSYFLETLFRSVEITEGEIIPNPIIIFDVSTKESDKVKIERVVKKKQIMGWNIKLVNGKKLIFLDDKYQYVDKNEYLDSESLESNVEKNFGYVLSLSETEYSMYIHSDIAFLMKNWRHYIVSKINDGLDAFGYSPFYEGRKRNFSVYNNYLPLNTHFVFAKTTDLLKVGFNHVLPKNCWSPIFEKNLQTDTFMESQLVIPKYGFNPYDQDLILKYTRSWEHPRVGWNWFTNYAVECGSFGNYIYDVGENVYTMYHIDVDNTIDLFKVFEKRHHELNFPDQIDGGKVSYLIPEIIRTGEGEEFVYHGPWRFNTRDHELWRTKVSSDTLRILEDIELEYLEQKELKK